MPGALRQAAVGVGDVGDVAVGAWGVGSWWGGWVVGGGVGLGRCGERWGWGVGPFVTCPMRMCRTQAKNK